MSVGNAGASSRNNKLDMQQHRMDNKQVIMTESSTSSSSVSSMDAANNGRSKKYYYLTPNAVQKLPKYQYHGADLSLLYKYILSPLAGWCVDNVTPTWLAPNAITSIGLCWMILSYGVIWYHCPGLYEANTDIINTATTSAASSAVPSAIFLLNGCAMLIYQTLDNMDGKQARKTGSSSPLGLLFDHGCDALNSIFGSANWIVAMGLLPGRVNDLLGEGEEAVNNIQNKSLLSEFLGGDAIIATVLILAPMIPFFVATWEHYFTGKLILPIFNGPSEGLVMGASLSFLSYFYGPMIWQQTTVTDGAIAFLEGRGMTSLSFLEGRVRNLDIIVLSALIALIQEVLSKIPFVIRSYGQTAVRALLPHIVFVVSTVVIISIDSTILLRIPRTMLHLISGVFVEQTTQLMLDHMVEERYAAFRWPLLPQVILASILTAGVQLSSDSVDIYCITYTTGLWIYLVLKIKVLVSEICDVLGIWCFDIVSPHPKRKKD
jgi:ethanolaminephosphotransferase